MTREGRQRWILVPLLAVFLLLATPRAVVAKPFTVSAHGESPHIAVDDSGTGHIVWSERVNGGDDILHYCRLPRGSRSCTPERTFSLGGEDFEDPRALYSGGVLTIVSARCCYPEDRLTVMLSSDGGQTFTPPRYIAKPTTFSSFSPMGGGGNAAVGPGPFQVSTASSGSGGSYFQTAPTTPGTPVSTAAQLDDDVPGPTADTINATVAFDDPLSPVFAFEQITSGRTFIRSYDGTGDYNSVANWAPSQLVGSGDEPQLAGGPRGVYLLYRIGKPTKRRYVARRIKPTGPGPTIDVSAKGSPIFRSFTEDSGGNLHAVWVDNGDPDRLRYSRSANGKRFSDPKTLAGGRDNVFDTDVAAGDDGGGWAVWDSDSGSGVIRAAPFGPVRGGGGGGSQPCVPKVSYGKVVVLAREGCLQKAGDKYTTAGAIRLNGLDLDPHGTGSARTAGASELVIDTAKGTLKSSGSVLAKAGNVELDDRKLAWKLPKAGGTVKDLAGNPATFETGKLKQVEFVGLPVLGQTTLEIGAGQGMSVPVHLKLPEPFGSLLGGGVSGDSTMHLDNASGLKLDNVSVTADSIFLGIAEVRDLEVDFVPGPFALKGSARILLPVIKSSLDTDVGFQAGDFDYAKATLSFDAPGRPVSQFTYLKSVGFQVVRDPLKLAGLASVTAGPTVPGLDVAAARVDGTISYTFPKSPGNGVFRADGKGYIANVPTSDVFAQYETSGKLSLGGSFDLSTGFGGPSLAGSVNGAVDFASGGFDLYGSGQGCGIPAIGIGCIGVKVLLSKKAAAGCGSASIGPPGAKVTISAGLARYWSSGDFDFFGGCDLKPYRTTSSARLAAASNTIRIPSGLPEASIKVEGVGAPPRIALTAPGGQKLISPMPPAQTTQNEVGAIGPSSYATATFASLPRPQGGTWTVDQLPGSAPIGEIAVADGLPGREREREGAEGRRPRAGALLPGTEDQRPEDPVLRGGEGRLGATGDDRRRPRKDALQSCGRASGTPADRRRGRFLRHAPGAARRRRLHGSEADAARQASSSAPAPKGRWQARDLLAEGRGRRALRRRGQAQGRPAPVADDEEDIGNGS